MLQLLLVIPDRVMKPTSKEKLKTQHSELNYPQERMICHQLIVPTKLHFLLHWQLVKSTGVILQYEKLKGKI